MCFAQGTDPGSTATHNLVPQTFVQRFFRGCDVEFGVTKSENSDGSSVDGTALSATSHLLSGDSSMCSTSKSRTRTTYSSSLRVLYRIRIMIALLCQRNGRHILPLCHSSNWLMEKTNLNASWKNSTCTHTENTTRRGLNKNHTKTGPHINHHWGK